ncbi:hypothetical protein D3C73_1422010 [compost metagenome]
MFGAILIDESHPATDLHVLGRSGGGHHLGAAQSLLEVAQVTFEVGQALLVCLVALGQLLGMQGLQLDDFVLQLAQAGWSDIVGLRADLPLDRLIGLRSGVIFIDECPAHGFLP